MTDYSPDQISHLQQLLTRGKFDEFSPEDWCLFFKGVIRTTVQERAQHGHTNPPAYLDLLPKIQLYCFPWPQQSRGSVVDNVWLHLEYRVPLSVRPNIATGLDLLVRESLDLIRAESPDTEGLLQEVLVPENLWGGVISGTLAEEIATSHTLPAMIRILVIQNMENRSFQLMVSADCWSKIREETREVPLFAASVMGWLTKQCHSFDALRMPIFMGDPGDCARIPGQIGDEIEKALAKISIRNSKGTLIEIFSKYPPWARELLDELELDLELPPP